MDSRIRSVPDSFFEVFVEIAPATDENSDPFVLLQYPEDYSNEEVLKSIPKFAFPCDTECTTVDHFTFVLTDIESKYRFGFCRHSADATTCLCIISFLPQYEIFYRLLNYVAEIIKDTKHSDPVPLLRRLHEIPVPRDSAPISIDIPDYKYKFDFVFPDSKSLPSIPENRNLTEYYNAVDTKNMMIIFASMIFERRILVTSKKLSRLTSCVHAASALLYPMYWQHLYIPVLPAHLLDYVSAPMPYLIGIHSSLMNKTKNQEVGDAVILDADNNSVTTEFNDLEDIPQEVVSFLRKRLRAHQTDRLKSSILGDGVSRSFLKALVALIGGYRESLVLREGEKVTFDRDKFVLSRPQRMQAFLEKLLQLQLFEQFIESRLDIINQNEGMNDEFENETLMFTDRSVQYKYNEWAGDMKHRGRKLKSDGKERMAVFTSKVRDKSRRAYKDIKTKLDDIRKDEDEIEPTPLQESPSSENPPSRPPAPDRSKLVRPGSIARRISYEKAISDDFYHLHDDLDDLGDRTRRYPIMELDDIQADDEAISTNHSRHESIVTPLAPPTTTSPLARANRSPSIRHGSMRRSGMISYTDDILGTCPRISTDLMDDPDIQGMFHRSYSTDGLEKCGTEDSTSDSRDEDLLYAQCMTDTLVDLDDTPQQSPSTSTKLTSNNSAPSLLDADLLQLTTPRDRSAKSASPTPETAPAPAPETTPAPIPAPRISLQKRQLGTLHNTGIAVPRPSRSNTPSPNVERRAKPVPSNPASLGIAPPNPAPTKPPPRIITSQTPAEAQTVKRASLQRHEAFTSVSRPVVAQRPPSIQRKPSIPKTNATDVSGIQNARRAFIESEVNKTNQLNPPHKSTGRVSPLAPDLDQFDPLATGQLAVDSGSLSGSGSSSSLLGGEGRTHSTVSIDSTDATHASGRNRGEDEDLLKVWNLDFETMNLTARPATTQAAPPVPPKPMSTTQQPNNRHSIHIGTGLGSLNNNVNTAYSPAPYRRTATLNPKTNSVFSPSALNGSAMSQSYSGPSMSQSYTAPQTGVTLGGPPLIAAKPPTLTPRRPSSVAAALERPEASPIRTASVSSLDPFSDALEKATNNNTPKITAGFRAQSSTLPRWPPTAANEKNHANGVEGKDTNRRSQWETFD